MMAIVKRAAIGFLVGMAVGDVIAFACATASGASSPFVSEALLARAGNEVDALLMQTVLSGVIGAIDFAAVGLYDLESWGLLKTAVVHYLICVAAFVPVALFLGWIDFDAVALGVTASALAVGYAVIWAIMYARYKVEVNELNELLEDVEQA